MFNLKEFADVSKTLVHCSTKQENNMKWVWCANTGESESEDKVFVEVRAKNLNMWHTESDRAVMGVHH